MSGVQPTVSSSDGAVSVGLVQATGDGWKQDDRLPLCDRRVQTLPRPYILSADVDVHVTRDVAVLENAVAERGEARHEIDQDVAHSPAARLDDRLARGLGPERGRDADRSHQTPRPAAQNST